MKRTPIWRWAAVACHLSALLAPGAWLYFVRHAGTSFRWAGFTGRNLLVCLVLSLLPTALFFLAQLLQRRRQQSAWGSVLACLLFLLAAAGWLYTLCDSWSLWNAGHADILLVPNIETGNVFYKSMVFMAKSQNAGLIVGAKAPVIVTSRADSEQTKLNSIALALAVAATNL